MRKVGRISPATGLATAALAAALALVLAACGGGEGGTVGTGDAATSAAARRPVFLEAARAGRAAPFVHQGADNSIPTFGVEAPTGERRRAEAVLVAFLRARAARRWTAVCRGLAPSYARSLAHLAKGGRGCPAVAAALVGRGDLSDPLRGGIVSLRVKGPSAVALFYGPAKAQFVMPMDREGGRWGTTQLAPIAYPPGAPAGVSG